MSAKAEGQPSFWASLRVVAESPRLLSVTLLGFSSGLPLGLVWFAIPTWLTKAGVDIRIIGLFTLAQAPWSFKFLWSPLMDRYAPPFLGRKRGWVLIGQVALLVLSMALAAAADRPAENLGLIGALTLVTAFMSATFDIAYDGYTVEVLRQEEQALGSGARVALYRTAMQVSGGVAITAAAYLSWKVVYALLGLCYLPLMLVTWSAPEPEVLVESPRRLRDAVWRPFVGFLSQHRALEILAFVLLYKLSDNLTQALTRPFFVRMGFGEWDYGFVTATVGQLSFIVGSFWGGVLTERMGLGRALWIFGFLQLFSNLGYALLAQVGTNRPLLYAAHGFEYISSGLGTGAFLTLLLRLTERRFSATQYALFSSLFSLPRVLSGPVAGVLSNSLGWRDFYVLTVFVGVPGLLMLRRFVPWSARDVRFEVLPPTRRPPLDRAWLLAWTGLSIAATAASGFLALGGLAAVDAFRDGRVFRLWSYLASLLHPRAAGEWIWALSVWILALMAGLVTAATLVARRGIKPRNGGAGPGVES